MNASPELAAGDAYDRELIGALRGAYDRVDPVPAPVIAADYQLGDLRDLVPIPQAGKFGRQWIEDNGDTREEDQP